MNQKTWASSAVEAKWRPKAIAHEDAFCEGRREVRRRQNLSKGNRAAFLQEVAYDTSFTVVLSSALHVSNYGPASSH